MKNKLLSLVQGKQKDEEIILKSTWKGAIKQFLIEITWIVIALILGLISYSNLSNILVYHKMGYFEAIKKILKIDSETTIIVTSHCFWIILLGLLVVLLVIGIILFICKFIDAFQESRNVTIINKEEMRIRQIYYAFLFRKMEFEIIFDQMIRVDLFQTSFDRLFNTGSFVLTLVIATDTGPIKECWGINYIENPQKVQKELSNLLTCENK